MSKGRNVEALLEQAKEKEGKNEWLHAAESYERASRSLVKLRDLGKIGEIQERRAHCLYRAAFQAETRAEFKERLKLAGEEYGEASGFYSKVGRSSKSEHCLAMSVFLQSWLELGSSERRVLLDKCCRIEGKVLEACKEADDRGNYGAACNELLSFLVDRLDLEWDWRERRRIVEEAIGFGESAILSLSDVGDKKGLTMAFCLTGLLYDYAEECHDLGEDRRRCIERSSEYARKAVELSEQIDDDYVAGLASYVMARVAHSLGGDLGSALNFARKTSERGTRTGDRFLIGLGLFLQAEVLYSFMQMEEDPDKRRKGCSKVIRCSEEALKHCLLVSRSWFVVNACYLCADSYVYLAREVETEPDKRVRLLEKAVEAGRRGLEYARSSGMPKPTLSVLHTLSKALHFLSNLEGSIGERRRLLEESSKYREEFVHVLERTFPFKYGDRGVGQNYFALIRDELAELETDDGRRKGLLQEAVASMERCLELCERSASFYKQPRLFSTIGRYRDSYGKILNRLYLLTGDKDFGARAIEVYERCIEAFGQVDMFSRVAEAQWQIARLRDGLGQYLDSARNFEAASKTYERVAGRISQLRDFYLDLSSYMRAWSEIERAKHCHVKEEYARSAEHYKRAAELHGSSKSWGYLAPNYSAWAHLESAEDLSRRGRGGEAVKMFKRAGRLFAQAKRTLEAEVPRIEGSDEAEVAEKLLKASDLRREYCRGRICLEEGRLLERRGVHQASAERYGLAAEIFQGIEACLESESERGELRPIICLCQAWEKMMLAEWKMLPELYREASELFERAKEQSIKERTILLASGNSSFCRALEAGTRFEASEDKSLYSTAKLYMERAANYYLKAGFKKAAMWVDATQAMFDAYVYMGDAETEMDHGKKMELYRLAESYLERSVSLYEKAGYLGKRDEVLRILEKVKEKRAFVVVLGAMLRAPRVASSTSMISTPTPVHENAAGLERFESARIEAYLSVPKELAVGEKAHIGLDLVNVAKSFGLIVRVEDLVPEGLDVTEVPPNYVVTKGSIDMKGRRLDSLKVESIKIGIRAAEAGIVDLCPRVVYVDEAGKFRVSRPNPVRLQVNPQLAFEFKTAEAERVFNYLVKAFIEDYMRRKLVVERSGWRSLMQIVEKAGVSRRSLYGTGGRRGPAISELRRRGLVEIRVFSGQRGRGGEVSKARICYEKETMKRYVDRCVGKTG